MPRRNRGAAERSFFAGNYGRGWACFAAAYASVVSTLAFLGATRSPAPLLLAVVLTLPCGIVGLVGVYAIYAFLVGGANAFGAQVMTGTGDGWGPQWFVVVDRVAVTILFALVALANALILGYLFHWPQRRRQKQAAGERVRTLTGAVDAVSHPTVEWLLVPIGALAWIFAYVIPAHGDIAATGIPYLVVVLAIALSAGFVAPSRHHLRIAAYLVGPAVILAWWTTPRGDDDGLWLVVYELLAFEFLVVAGAHWLGKIPRTWRAYRSPTIENSWGPPLATRAATVPAGGGETRQRPHADWYPDPAGQAEWRYWDGHAWTEQQTTTGTTHLAPDDAARALVQMLTTTGTRITANSAVAVSGSVVNWRRPSYVITALLALFMIVPAIIYVCLGGEYVDEPFTITFTPTPNGTSVSVTGRGRGYRAAVRAVGALS